MNKLEIREIEMSENKGVLIIYTGGTIGSMPKDPQDEASPQIVVGWDKFKKKTPEVTEERLGFKLDFKPTSKLLDSCNIGPSIWSEVADIIHKNYDNYEGFVILHGTDTMVYTACALSYMLVNLSKPVVITGSQRTHLFQVRNDGLQNMITAITIANPKASQIPTIPEVMICFGTDLLRGNRAKKKDANGFEAYESPKYPRLAKIGANIEIDEGAIRTMPTQSFFVRKNLELNVIDFSVFPGIVENRMAQKLLDDTELKGVVVRAYGAGNIPTEKQYLKAHQISMQQRDVTMINVTQCTHGRVELGLYETSNELLKIGMVSGTDQTPESALIKLMVGLGDEDLVHDKVGLRNFLQTSQAGEQSTSIVELPFPAKNGDVSPGKDRFRFAPDRELSGDWTEKELESAQLRIYDAEVTGSGEKFDDAIDLEIYANLSSQEDPAGPASPQFASSARRAPTSEATILSFDVTDATRRLFKPGTRANYSIFLRSEGGLSWGKSELALFIKS